MIDAQFVNQLVLFLWMPLFMLWGIGRAASKQTTHSRSEVPSRIAVWCVAAAWILLFSHGFHRPLLTWRFIPMTPATVYIGLALTVVGLMFSVWARFHIGRNWSPQIEIKEDHQLIGNGPYAVVRHPIYSGFMLATLGTAIAFGELSGLLSFMLIVTAWGYKAGLEERAMLEQFGAEYERYRQKVKGLIPFVW